MAIKVHLHNQNYNYNWGGDNLEILVCKCCGANSLYIKDGYMICEYCDSKFLLTAREQSLYHKQTTPMDGVKTINTQSGISLAQDIEILLHKCRTRPKEAKRYANLILDIDPDNTEALKYL